MEKRDSKPTRRQFLSHIMSVVATAPTTTINFALLAELLFGNDPDQTSSGTNRENRSLPPKIDKQVNKFNEKIGFYNLGVTHLLKYLPEYISKNQQTIADSDIVLLENGGSFFEELKRYCQDLGKDVKVIDSGFLFQITVAPFALFKSLFAQYSLFKLNILNSNDRAEWLKNVAKHYGWDHLTTFSVSAVSTILSYENSGRNQYPRLDFSYTTDARTVLMYANIIKIVQENPGKKVLVISGNFHALGFEHYANNVTDFENDLRKAIYSVVYFLHYQPETFIRKFFGLQFP